jgi:hypothetical protein
MISLRTAGEAITLVGLLVLGGLGWNHFRSTNVVNVTQSSPTTKVVTVDGPIRDKIVRETIQDPTQAALITKLLSDNGKLRLQISSISSTQSTLTSSGGDKSNGGEGTITPTVQGPSPLSFNFKDYQLNANYSSDGKGFSYELTQGFRIIATSGKTPTGSSVSSVELFRQTPTGPVRVPTETVQINGPENPTRWIFSPRIQGGVGYGTAGKEEIVALQWFKFGSTPAAEDVRFSILSLGVSNDGLTLLPVSVNLGRIKHNPLTNLWASLTVSSKSLGAALTVTF